jgi:3-hydroxyacyl-CoA dehydrogenase
VIKTVTVLGTGSMGAGMARDLASPGPDVTVWNRSPEKARALSGPSLVADAMRAAGTNDTPMEALYARFAAAAGAGHDAEDMAAVWHAFRVAS